MNVIIYGKPGCGYCVKAKSLCEAKGINYQYKQVGSDITKEQLVEMVGKEVRTVPQIFIQEDGFFNYVGGYDQLKEKLV